MQAVALPQANKSIPGNEADFTPDSTIFRQQLHLAGFGDVPLLVDQPEACVQH